MRSAHSELAPAGPVAEREVLGAGARGTGRIDPGSQALKVPVAGGAGAGKTTLIGSVSEVRPLRTGKKRSGAAEVPAAGPTRPEGPATVDFGRIPVRPGLSLCLFAMPAADAHRSAWNELTRGALGAVVLADAERLEDCFPSVNYFERNRVPFVVAVNCLSGESPYAAYDIARALDLDARTPVMLCDARDRDSAKEVLIRLLDHAGRRQLTEHVTGHFAETDVTSVAEERPDRD
ncbi:ATP/GTP-binding protein [Streptomyces sp. NPDC048172]|uniref:GTP-binding protein n=1 Tax=Streptomyces sp. NPDC048172 TaxID=3365505 RepID=UPI0037194609